MMEQYSVLEINELSNHEKMQGTSHAYDQVRKASFTTE